MEQQTPLEWLFQELEEKGELRETLGIVQLNIFTSDYLELKRKVKEMEKERLEQFYDHGSYSILGNGHGDTFEKYYNETFKNK